MNYLQLNFETIPSTLSASTRAILTLEFGTKVSRAWSSFAEVDHISIFPKNSKKNTEVTHLSRPVDLSKTQVKTPKPVDLSERST